MFKFEKNQIFKAHNRAQNRTYTYKYLGIDTECLDTCYNIALQNVNTGDIIHVENEWFNQRKITL